MAKKTATTLDTESKADAFDAISKLRKAARKKQNVMFTAHAKFKEAKTAYEEAADGVNELIDSSGGAGPLFNKGEEGGEES